MKKIARILAWLFGLGALGLILAIGLLYQQREAITRAVLSGLNEQLAAPIEVGDIGLSLRSFPSAALHLQKVYSPGAFRATDTLLQCQSLYLEFDLWSVFRDEYRIEGIRLEDGLLQIRINAAGKGNYEIWKDSADQGGENSVFALEQIQLDQMQVRVQLANPDLQSRNYVRSLSLEGRLSAAGQKLKGHLDAKLQVLQLDGEAYLQAPVAASSNWQWEATEANWTLSALNLKIADISPGELEVTGGKGWQVQALWRDSELTLWQQLLSAQGLWPKGNWGKVAGRARIEAEWKGEAGQETEGEVQLSGSQLAYRESEIPLEGLYLEARYRERGGHSLLAIDSLYSESHQLWGHAQWTDQSQLKAKLHARLELRQWQHYLALDSLQVEAGWVETELHYRGKLREDRQYWARDLSTAQIEGYLALDDCRFGWGQNSQPYREVKGRLSAKNKRLNIEELRLHRGSSALRLAGHFENYLPALLLPDQPLKLRGSLQSEHLRMEDFYQSSRETTNSEEALRLSPLWDLELGFAVDKFTMGHFEGKALRGKLRLREQQVVVEGLELEADQGRYQAALQLNMSGTETYALAAQFSGSALDIASVFASFDNFGQQTLTAQHLSGQASANAQFSARLSPQMDFDAQSLQLQAFLRIDQGRLRNFEPMEALSHFADIEELRDVRFSRLENRLEIAKGRILIPNMDIQSNVLQMQLKGQHYFDNRIDYTLRLQLSDVLFKRRQEQGGADEFSEHLSVQERSDDHIIPLSLRGSVDNPVLSIDRQALKQDLRSELQKQKEELKELFQKKKAPKAKESGIIFEWDEG